MPEDEKVGYRKPPVAHRFKPGVSGNPSGRRKGARGFKTDLKAALEAPVQVTVQGRKSSISTQAAAIKRLVERAVVKGDQRAIEKLLGYAQQIETTSAPEQPELDPDDQAIIAEFLKRNGGI